MWSLGRHVDDAGGADIALGRFDRVAQLGLVGRAGALDGVDRQHQAVVGMAAEGRDIALVARLVVALVGRDDGLLRVAGRQQVGHQQGGCGQAHAVGGRARQLDVFLRSDAVRLVQRQRQADLAVVARDDRRALAEAGVQHRLRAAGADLRELRRHVGVGRAVGLVGDELDAVLGCDLQALAAHRLVEAAGARNQRHLGQLARLQVGEDLLAGHAISVRRLEDPLLDRLDDHRPPRRARRKAPALPRPAAPPPSSCRWSSRRRSRRPCPARAGAWRRCAPSRRRRHRRSDELQLAAEHAALGIDALDHHLERLLLRVAEEGRRPGDREEGADANRLLRQRAASRAEQHAGHDQRAVRGNLMNLMSVSCCS